MSDSVQQYSIVTDEINTADAVTDSLFSSKNNSKLDVTQIRNIGTGLLGQACISKITGRLNTNIGFDRINQALKVILHTVLEEVPMLPILGSNLSSLLFEPADELLADSLKICIQQAITELEPRVRFQEITFDYSRVDNNELGLYVEYQLTNTNITYIFRDTIITGNGGDQL